jgi:hypothetical protein
VTLSLSQSLPKFNVYVYLPRPLLSTIAARLLCQVLSTPRRFQNRRSNRAPSFYIGFLCTTLDLGLGYISSHDTSTPMVLQAVGWSMQILRVEIVRAVYVSVPTNDLGMYLVLKLIILDSEVRSPP